MAIATTTPDILGERQSGQDVRTQNGTRVGICISICTCYWSMRRCQHFFNDDKSLVSKQWWHVKLLPTLSSPHLILSVSTRLSFAWSLLLCSCYSQPYMLFILACALICERYLLVQCIRTKTSMNCPCPSSDQWIGWLGYVPCSIYFKAE